MIESKLVGYKTHLVQMDSTMEREWKDGGEMQAGW
jgi:hypothetical protein